MTDWLAILKEQAETGDQMARDVPKMLADTEISRGQVKTLFAALEKQAEFVEILTAALEKFGYDFEIIKAAETAGGALCRPRGSRGREAQGDDGVGRSTASGMLAHLRFTWWSRSSSTLLAPIAPSPSRPSTSSGRDGEGQYKPEGYWGGELRPRQPATR